MTTVTTVRPTDLRQAHQVMVDLAAERASVLLRGAGTAQDWGAPVTGVDAVLDTTGMAEIVDYQPRDMTLTVQAGIPLARVLPVLAEQGQWVALDAARVDVGATVGGLLATADAGPRRHAHGGPRDLVLGATIVLADGTVARSGGHVIKNVAGYDLAKLFSGSYGTLGLLAEVVLRVHPLPAVSATFVASGGIRRGVELAARLLAEPVEPSAVEWCADRLLVRFTGHPDGVANRLDRATAICGPETEVLTGAEERTAWQAVADVALGVPGDTVVRAGMLPSRLPETAARLFALAGEHGVRAELAASLGVGVHTVCLSGGTAWAHAGLVNTWRAEIAALRGTVSVRRRRDGFDDHAAGWGPPPPALPALRAVKRAFDPDDRLGPGRFAPWF